MSKYVRDLRFGQVGAHKPFKTGDQARLAAAFCRLAELGGLLEPLPKVVHDVVNLEYGRDFLAESEKYDVVFVHSVFDGWPEVEKVAWGTAGAKTIQDEARLSGTHVSPLHSRPAWRDRLAATEAEWLVLIGGLPSCLWVGSIPGYVMLDSGSRQLVVYRKEA